MFSITCTIVCYYAQVTLFVSTMSLKTTHDTRATDRANDIFLYKEEN